MELTLTPELEQLIQRHMDSGRYDKPYHVVINALVQLRMKDPDRRMSTSELEVLIQEGLDSAENEPPMSEEEAHTFLASVRAELMQVSPAVKAHPRG
jgi:Arc/MetJ-type ribon-helix-helix transcriptional regulator